MERRRKIIMDTYRYLYIGISMLKYASADECQIRVFQRNIINLTEKRRFVCKMEARGGERGGQREKAMERGEEGATRGFRERKTDFRIRLKIDEMRSRVGRYECTRPMGSDAAVARISNRPVQIRHQYPLRPHRTHMRHFYLFVYICMHGNAIIIFGK